MVATLSENLKKIWNKKNFEKKTVIFKKKPRKTKNF